MNSPRENRRYSLHSSAATGVSSRRSASRRSAVMVAFLGVTSVVYLVWIRFCALPLQDLQFGNNVSSRHHQYLLDRRGEHGLKKNLADFKLDLRGKKIDGKNPKNVASDQQEVSIEEADQNNQNNFNQQTETETIPKETSGTISSPNETTIKKDTSKAAFEWKFDPERIRKIQQQLLQETKRTSPVLTAYVEDPLPKPSHNEGVSSSRQLPLRTQSPEQLKKYTYDKVTKCSQLPTKFPVNHPRELNDVFKNVNNITPMYTKKYEYAKYCPVDADPYLPWIHDVFPSQKLGTSKAEYIELVAQNKRRCNTDDSRFGGDLENLEPQVAIMQPVPVKRISSEDALALAPELWSQPQSSTGGASFEVV